MRKFSRLPVSWIAAFLVFGLAGCGPEKSIQWSPDGNQSAIVSDGKLYFGDEEGNISAATAEGVERIAWLSDSRHMVVVSKREIRKWAELVRNAPLGFEEKRVVEGATAVGEELLRYTGEPDKFEPSNAALLTPEELFAAVLFLLDFGDPRVKEKFRGMSDLKDLALDLHDVRVIDCPEPAKNDTLLFSALYGVGEIRITADARVLAFVTMASSPDNNALFVAPVSAGAKAVLVSDRVASHPDWSPDGRNLAYIRSNSQISKGPGLGTILIRQVRDDAGAILQEPNQARELAAVLFRDNLKLRWLADGRVLFAAEELLLPSDVRDARPGLFALDPARQATVSRVLARTAESMLPDRLDLFELSPDQKRLAVPGSKGKVSVVTLASGQIEEVVEKNGAEDLATIPVWRNSEQLCVLLPAGSGEAKRNEVALWSSGKKITVISKSWPDAVLGGIK